MIVSSVSPGTSSITSAAIPSDSSKPYTWRDVGMVERREQTRFALESRAAIGAAGECGRQDFDRDVAPELCVPRAIDLAHAARADPRLDLVDAQTASCQIHDRLGMVAHQARDLLDGRPLQKPVAGVLDSAAAIRPPAGVPRHPRMPHEGTLRDPMRCARALHGRAR